jgi:SUMO ligase MMS21 Smc5/6 complex component
VEEKQYEVLLEKVDACKVAAHEYCVRMRTLLGEGGGAGDDSDSDIEVDEGRGGELTKCPITLSEWNDPVRSKRCGHSYNRSGIESLIGRKTCVQCPLAGCNQRVTKADLVPDKRLVMLVKKRQRAAERERRKREQEADADCGGA